MFPNETLPNITLPPQHVSCHKMSPTQNVSSTIRFLHITFPHITFPPQNVSGYKTWCNLQQKVSFINVFFKISFLLQNVSCHNMFPFKNYELLHLSNKWLFLLFNHYRGYCPLVSEKKPAKFSMFFSITFVEETFCNRKHFVEEIFCKKYCVGKVEKHFVGKPFVSFPKVS